MNPMREKLPAIAQAYKNTAKDYASVTEAGDWEDATETEVGWQNTGFEDEMTQQVERIMTDGDEVPDDL